MNKATTCLVCLLALSLYLIESEFQLIANGRLRIHVLDVGQGDSILIQTPAGAHILIDGGPDLSVLEQLSRHLPFFDRTIELLVLTHPDADHITGMPELFNRYTVESILLTGADHRSSRYVHFVRQLEFYGPTVVIADHTKDIIFDDGVTLDIIHPQRSFMAVLPQSPNDESVVFRLLYKDESILFTGDIEEAAENDILRGGHPLASSIIKVPHHGSRTSSSTGFLLATNPRVALVSAGGSAHKLGHPHKDVVERYKNLGILVRGTQNEGSISLEF